MSYIFTKNFYRGTLIVLFLLSTCLVAFAQNTVVKGTVTDAKTKETLPYVTVVFAGSTQGISTDNNGKFSISTSNATYTQIKISFVGYLRRDC